jgi:probable biosynthetic protein (TIGR04099 family)
MSVLEEVYIAGMPQLSYQGLSENWLLKECGHRHWLALAELNNQSLPEFHDASGNKAYAAFTAVKITSKTLEKIEENQSFSVRSEVARVGAARYYGEHSISSRSFNAAQVSMLSTFVYRREHGNNQSVTRANFVNEPQEFNGDRKELDEWIAFAKAARSNNWVEHLGIQRFASGDKKTITFNPSPYSDYNGAYFLYFANFQNFIDRAEWEWFKRDSIWALDRRELYFYGNINVGDPLIVSLGSSVESASELKHWCEIYDQHNVKIADVFTTKRKVKNAA